MALVRLAIPSEGEGGLDGLRAGHFGHCDVFTCVDIEDGKIGTVRIVANKEHVQGGCMVPVQLLAQEGVNALSWAALACGRLWASARWASTCTTMQSAEK